MIDALRGIAASATPLWQREAGDRVPMAGLAEKRFERWQRIIGAPPVMARRLRSAPVDGPALHALLGGAHSLGSEQSLALAGFPAPEIAC